MSLRPRASSGTPEFRRWLSFLAETKTDARNQEVLRECLAQYATESPERFHHFIQFLTSTMKNGRATPTSRVIAENYLTVMSPICDQFGYFEEKSVLDTLCFRLLDPAACKNVEKILRDYKRTSRAVINAVTAAFKQLLDGSGFVYTIRGRYKHPYSIHKKLQLKSYDSPLKLNDIFAFRIVLAGDREEQCFEALNVLHDEYRPIPGRFKDYVSIPKINGYQSLHTVLNGVLSDLDLPVEVQIRTRLMDEVAERGLASHWLYSKAKRASLLSEKERNLLARLEMLSKEAKQHLFVYCLSPDGDLFQLPQNATAVDFAYHIHTEVGNRAKNAVINGETCEIDRRLQSGDRVRILTSSEKTVTPDWIRFAVSPSTRKKIYENV